MTDRNDSFFHDPVHGHIRLGRSELAIVDSAEFQRLRFVRQLSLLHYVFPGASHSRFAHSVGACHIAGMVARQLFPGVPSNNLPYAIQVFRYAALLHDVGHGAFSHSLDQLELAGGEPFMPRVAEVLENAADWGVEHEALLTGAKALPAAKPIPHEWLSVAIAARILRRQEKVFRDVGAPIDSVIADLACMILKIGEPSPAFSASAEQLADSCQAEWPRIGESQFDTVAIPQDLMKLLSTLVSGTLDVDRMDYLLRDSQCIGVNYGLFDRDGIVASLRPVISAGHVRLGINAKRTNTVDDYLWSRYQMFRQIYCHKTHNAYNLLLQRALRDLHQRGAVKRPRSLDDFLELTDDLVMAQIFAHGMQEGDRSWVRAFAERQLPRYLGVVEASQYDDLWLSSPQTIFASSDIPKYDGWESDSSLAWYSLKTEVIRAGSESESTLPVVVERDKQTGKYREYSYLSKSVFFNQDLRAELRLRELRNRLNKRLLFFFRFE